MTRRVKCNCCNKEFDFEIPTLNTEKIKFNNDFENSTSLPGFDLRCTECPKCKCSGGLVACYTPNSVGAEKSFYINPNNNMYKYLYLQHQYPIKLGGKEFKSVKHYLQYCCIANDSDKNKFLKCDEIREREKLYKTFILLNSKQIKEQQYKNLEKIVRAKLKQCKKFKEQLFQLSGYTIYYKSSDAFLGIKTQGFRRYGENAYGLLLMKLCKELEEE
jgi:predicted NAD-dependent protein-ADP-ribosyltransferase YbiA (DUF1768 family)